ncbi:methyltransferase family protein [Ureibacillus xyleni]|uniref:Methyltransferase family protein n=1 Tax=Ureibacillus xyleni TaxID=614648 RepID=A0A285RD89_9BACL|nr:class I SAM-dependent methyltransferase [Ureibacillus xyleni]SOB92031.1 methyltransferase family protein [Ureibacillus xyleni]
MSNVNKDYWNAQLYDENHSFVSNYGSNILELLKVKEGEMILDLGCGTGDIANKLYEKGAKVFAVDLSKNMIAAAKSKYPNITFGVMNATDLEYENMFEAVFSNATLHWVKPPIKALQCIYKSLKDGGRFVAEFGGKGNVSIITNEIINQIRLSGNEFNEQNNPWYYPSVAEYTTLMEEVGFRVTFAQHIDRPTPLNGEGGLKNWINMFGQQLLDGIDDRLKEQIIVNVENALKPNLFKEGYWEADYKRIRVIGVK